MICRRYIGIEGQVWLAPLLSLGGESSVTNSAQAYVDIG